MTRSIVFFFGWILFDACLDRIDITIPGVTSRDIIVEGLITDAPGPYSVKLSQATRIDAALPLGLPISAKQITMFDNAGNSEVLKEKDKGLYQTNPNGMQGVVGREYYIRVETFEGQVIESLPDKMAPVGAVDSVYYEFEARQPEQGPTEYGFRIYIDAHTPSGDDNFVRWKFAGTYVVETLPRYNVHFVQNLCAGRCEPYCPLTCSGGAFIDGKFRPGYAFNPSTGTLEYVIGLACSCCRCWVTAPEGKPKVNDGQISSEGKFNKVEVGYVPINFYTFFEKYRVEVKQMSLSRAAYDYWKAIQAQKEGVGNLFQPVTGRVPSNVFESNKAPGVQGIFYASAITKKQIYLDKNTHRAEIYVPTDCQGRQGAMGEDCRRAFPGSVSTTVRPSDWK